MKFRLYFLIKKLHLYASLAITGLLLMYIASSYIMIHYQWFGTYERSQSSTRITVDSSDLLDDNWKRFLRQNGVTGRLTGQDSLISGELIQEYGKAGRDYVITVDNNRSVAEIKSSKGNLAGILAGIHRIRGFEGSMQYVLYGIFLDLTGVCLILFAITGMIMWLNLLKNDKIAWCIFLLGLLYVSVIVGYFSMN